MDSLSFNNQEELAAFLDTNCTSWNVFLNNRNLQDKLKTANFPPELASNLNLELVILGFWFEGTIVKREWSAQTDAGEEIGAPMITDLKPAAFEYIIQRFEETENSYLKARYGLILWNAPRPFKHMQYIKAALDHLLIALETASCIGREDRINCMDLLRQVCAIADTVRYRETDTIISILERFTNDIPFELNDRNHLLGLIVDYAKLFREQTLKILETTRNLIEENLAVKNFSSCLYLAEKAAPFAQGSKLDVQEWHFRQGQALEALAEQHLSEDSSLNSMQFYTRAAQAYQLAGNAAAEQQALRKAQELKGNLRLSTIETKLPDDFGRALQEDIKRRTDYLLSLSSDKVFEYLAHSEEVLPDFNFVKEQVAQSDFSISDLATIVGIDVNKNFQSAAQEMIDGLPAEKIRDQYRVVLSIRLHYLIPLFLEGIKSGKINFTSLKEFLNKTSWIAQHFQETDFAGGRFDYTWQPIVYPALQEFFRQLELLVRNDPAEPYSFVLCFDSLTLKIEGLLREVLQQIGATTLAANKKSDLREVYFDELLDIAKQNGILNESEAFFFRFVFTPLNQNLRNNIAHAYFYLPGHYSLENMILVLCALLRLCKGRLTEAPSEQTE